MEAARGTELGRNESSGFLLRGPSMFASRALILHLHYLAPVTYWDDGCSQGMRKRWYWWRGF
jgi:hypothetical protein